jgi:hypothetical protein
LASLAPIRPIALIDITAPNIVRSAGFIAP